jgi:hypothetical protein
MLIIEIRAIELIIIYVFLLGNIGFSRIEDIIINNEKEKMKYIKRSATKYFISMILYRDVAGSFTK